MCQLTPVDMPSFVLINNIEIKAKIGVGCSDIKIGGFAGAISFHLLMGWHFYALDNFFAMYRQY